jgi:Domain of unknown function (DUF5658)
MTRVLWVIVFVCAAAHPAPAQDVQAPAADAAPHRPSILVPLYVSSAALQGVDLVTTRLALQTGSAAEANPVMQHVVGNDATLFAVKAGTAAGTIWIVERMWKRHRVAAVALMIGVNATMGAVVGHNLRTLSAIR